jgi:dihydroorotase
MEYKAELEKLDPKVEYLMTLYLHENMLEEIEVEGQKTLRGVQEVRKASKAGVKGKLPVHPYDGLGNIC